MGTAQVEFQEELWGGATGSDVTGQIFPHTFFPRFFLIPALFTYYSCSTSSTVGQVLWLPEVTEVHPKGFPWVRACATGSCAISALVGSFHWKPRHQTSRDLFGVLLEGWGTRMHNLKLCNIRSEVPLGCSLGRPRLSFPTPFTGYLPLSRHFLGEPFQWLHFLRLLFSDMLCSTPSSLSRPRCIFVIFSEIF